MKKAVLKVYITVVCLFSNLLIFADPPGDDSDTGDLSGGDPPTGPIDDYIWVLAVLVLFYAFWKLKSVQNKSISN
jgi:hypothetical protein